MSPTNFSWEDVTVFSNGWDKRFHYIPKRVYDDATPDFKSKRIAGITDEIGIFAIAFAPESETKRTEPFPKVVLKATSSPEPVRPGQNVTHTLTFTNTASATTAEVNVKEVLMDLDYVSATPSQGICTQKEAGNIIVCHLGTLSGRASTTITIVSHVRSPFPFSTDNMSGGPESLKEVVCDLEVVFKQSATDFVDERGQIFSNIKTTISNDH